MNDYINKKDIIDALYDSDAITMKGIKIINMMQPANVIDRDEGIRIGAELAAMHGSDATSQQLEESFWNGFEEAMKKRDVQPILHGTWHKERSYLISTHTYDYGILVCDVCLTEYSYDAETGMSAENWNFCPICGAKWK